MHIIKYIRRTIVLFISIMELLVAQGDPYSSGGELIREQGAYDVTHYDLDLLIDPENKYIDGSLTVTALALDTLSWLVLDLDTKLIVDSVVVGRIKQNFERRQSKLWIKLNTKLNNNSVIKAKIFYNGNPKVAENPPWEGGFNWSKTGDDSYWIGVSCEFEGADIWWPCKDNPSDEPDSIALHFTIPKPYFCASNGKLVSIQDNLDGTHTFNWNVSTPINNYSVTINIANYKELTGQYQSVTGDVIDLYFWVLPVYESQAIAIFPEISKQLEFFEKYFGPYPFRAEKLGYVHTDYAGMEHQTIISYGEYNGRIFSLNELGVDYILLHETAHEWWGNLVTAEDWKDAWIHEGFATYAEALYVEYSQDIDSYHRYVSYWYGGARTPIVSHESKTMREAFSNNIYYRGALVLHTLRYLLGDTIFFKLLRKMVYPNLNLENDISGAACRLVTTKEFIDLVEQLSSMNLDWFFELYLYGTELPTLLYSIKDGNLLFKWSTPSNYEFNMPVPVEINGIENTVTMNNGEGSIYVGDDGYEIDPLNWILKEEIIFEQSEPEIPDNINIFKIISIYPNPTKSVVYINIITETYLSLIVNIYDINGKSIGKIFSDDLPTGNHLLTWDTKFVSSGQYYLQVVSGNKTGIKKFTILK